MSNELTVKVAERASAGNQWWEGTVDIQGLRPTKLARKSDGSTKFTTRSSVTGAAKRLATSLGFEGVAVDVKSATATPATKTKRAAKKKATPRKSTTTKKATPKKSTATKKTAKTTTKSASKKRSRKS